MSRYREVGLLAEGGMALIARAERDDGATVVLKRVRPPFCFDPSFLRLFADEGAVHAALDHEHIVRLLDRGEDEAGPYLVFEHVDGTDLGAILEAGKPVDVECLLAVALPLFKALAAAHEAKDAQGQSLAVVHRDVSPGNVLLGMDGSVKLADFGVASFALKSEVTVAGEMKGKFAYMAPEQTRGEKVGPRADLFAAGVVLWEALAGKRLFDGPTDADVVAAVRNQPAPRLEPPVPPELTALVARLLEKEPGTRPASAREVVAALDAIALSLGLDEGLARFAARLARTAPRRTVKVRDVDGRRQTQRVVGPAPMTVRRRPRTVPLLVAAGVAAAVVVALGLVPRGDPTTTTPLPDVPAPPPSTTAANVTPPPPPSTTAAAPEPSAVSVAPAVPEKRPRKSEGTKGALLAAASTGSTGSTAGATRATDATATTAAPVGFGKLSIMSEPWASVTIDGNLVAKETPLRGFTLSAGKHTVVLANPVYKISRSLVVEIPVDGDIKKFVDLNSP